MQKKSINPEHVQSVIGKHLLTDGYDLTLDLEKSQGVYLHDAKYKREILDFFTCFASLPLGYNHPKMVNNEVFKKDLLLAALTNPSNSDIYTVQYAKFIDTFSRIGIPSYLPHAFFISGGGLAVENALKAAMDWKVQKNFQKGYIKERGHQVIHFEKAFHGRTGYTMSLTNTLPDKTKWYAKFNWPRITTPYIDFPFTDEGYELLLQREQEAIKQIKQAFLDHKDDICAIIIEPIQGEGGDNHVRKEFLEQLRVLADEHGALLIYDEVQTGVGLTGKFWCHEHFGPKARPDILAFGKKMQVCGILAGTKLDEIATNVFKIPSRINSTWGGSLVDMVRATRILEIIEEDQLVLNAAEVGSYLQQQLAEIAQRFPILSNIRGRGMMVAFDFPNKESRDHFLKRTLAKNVLLLGCGEHSVRFRPALLMQKTDIDKGLSILSDVLENL